MVTATFFWSGRSQAVRLPKDFRFDGKDVRIRRHCGALTLEPIAMDWAWLDALAGPVDADVQQVIDRWSNSSVCGKAAASRVSPSSGHWRSRTRPSSTRPCRKPHGH